MIARVTLELALRKEFDYLIPPEFAEQVDVGSRVQVPFGPRKVLGCVPALAVPGDMPKLAKRQKDIWHILEERRELPLKELLDLANTTTATIRRLEDKGLVTISAQISERDPYEHEHILPSLPL